MNFGYMLSKINSLNYLSFFKINDFSYEILKFSLSYNNMRNIYLHIQQQIMHKLKSSYILKSKKIKTKRSKIIITNSKSLWIYFQMQYQIDIWLYKIYFIPHETVFIWQDFLYFFDNILLCHRSYTIVFIYWSTININLHACQKSYRESILLSAQVLFYIYRNGLHTKWKL